MKNSVLSLLSVSVLACSGMEEQPSFLKKFKNHTQAAFVWGAENLPIKGTAAIITGISVPAATGVATGTVIKNIVAVYGLDIPALSATAGALVALSLIKNYGLTIANLTYKGMTGETLSDWWKKEINGAKKFSDSLIDVTARDLLEVQRRIAMKRVQKVFVAEEESNR